MFTEPDRKTRVSINTTAPVIQTDGSAAVFLLTYRIEEGPGTVDGTVLEFRQQIRVPEFGLPPGQRIIDVGMGTQPVHFEQIFIGKDHEFHDVTDQMQETFLTALEFRFDGPGNDDAGNATLRTSIAIPALVEIDD